MPHTARLKTLLILALFALVWFGNIQYRDLFQTDEGRYAEIPREMLASGDWITPRLDGFKYFEKPPLQYWATALAYRIFGLHNWTARLWSALTGFCGVLLIGFAGGRLYDARTGWCAALVLASSLYYGFMGHFNSLDMGLAFFMSLNLLAFLLAQRLERRSSQRGWMYVSFAAAAFAVLSKGLEAVVLPGLVLVLYTLIRRDWGLWRRLHLVGGLLVFLVITAPWFILAAEANAGFLWFFFIHEHIDRYLTPVAHRPGPWWLFLPIFVFGLAPWFPQMLRAVVSGARNLFGRARGFDLEICLWLWVIVIIGFFSFSDSKLESYILPVMPAAALLVGRQVAVLRVVDIKWSSFVLAAAGIVGLWFTPSLGAHHKNWPAALYAHLSPWLYAAFGVWLAAAALALVLVRRRAVPAVGITACGMLLGWQVLITGSQVLSPVYSTHMLARRIGGANQAGTALYTIKSYEQALPFYLRRTVTPVAYQGELAFGMAQAPEKWIPSLSAFQQRWRRDDSGALAMLPKALYPRFRAKGLRMRVIAEDPHYVVVQKP